MRINLNQSETSILIKFSIKMNSSLPCISTIINKSIFLLF